MRLELTLPALERLLGGDTEIEVGLRHQVAEEFAKKHLKTIVNDAAFAAISATWHAEINAAVVETMKSLRGDLQDKIDSGEVARTTLRWTWNLKETIEKAAATAVEESIQQSAKKWTTDIDRIVLREVRKQMEQCVDAELATRVKDRTSALGRMIEDEVEARIQERLEATKNFRNSS